MLLMVIDKDKHGADVPYSEFWLTVTGADSEDSQVMAFE